ncbi:filamentous hemagglutinin N-terminal domain-containing protein [Stenotrophomonas sp. NPDC077659]|uniref:two-partner secretion domain-containing protein n=1 Tax=Stenotrophomonas sp. NPDC077659 TaxID=3390694 RepID=UPI003D091352
MNRIYRLVFNAALGQVQVAGEFANAPQCRATRAGRAGQLLLSLLAAAVLAVLAPATQAADLPTGFAPVSGSATLTQAGNTMRISQNGKVSLINWTTFDIATGHAVAFDMPSTASGSINIISGGSSQISGSLSSIGNVVLVNTSGIIFNQGSVIDVGGLLATSLPPTNTFNVGAGSELPLNWEFKASGAPAAIVNEGTLIAQSGGVNLIGGRVVNAGDISAAGNVSLVVGNRVTSSLMSPNGTEPGRWNHVVTDVATSSGSWAVNNTGRLSGSAIDLHAKVNNALFSGGINSTGIMQAHGINGGSLIVQTSGAAHLDFGATTNIGLVSSESSQLSALGTLNASSISLMANGPLELGASLNAGNISLIGSSISQQYDGAVGALKGDVALETQGNAQLDSSSNAITNLRGFVGLGLLLSSTTDVAQNGPLAVAGSTLLNGLADPSGRIAGFTFDRTDNIFATTINGAGGALVLNSSGLLNLGSLDVVSLAVQANAIRLMGSIGSVGSQTYTGPLTVSAAATLYSTGSGALTFNGTINGAGALMMDTDGAVTFGGAVGGSSALGTLTRVGAGTTWLNGNVTTSGAIDIAGNVLLGGDVQLRSTSGQAISLGGTVDSSGAARALVVDTSGATTFGGAIGATTALASLQTLGGGSTRLGGNVTTSGTIDLQDNLLLGTDAALTSTGNQAITLGGTVDSTGGARSLTLATNGLATFGGSVGGNSALSSLQRTGTGGTRVGGNITATGDIVLQGGLQATGSTAISSTGNGRIDVGGPITASGGVALSGGDIIVGGDISAASVGIDAATFSGAGITSNSTLDINVANGALLQNGAYIAGGNAAFSAAGDIVLTNAQNQLGGPVSLHGEDVTLANQGNLRLGSVDAQTLQVNSTGSISQANNTHLDVTGTSSFTSTGGISLLGTGNALAGAVSLSGGAAQITASGDLRFGALTVDSLIANADTVYLPQLLTTLGGQSYSGRLMLEGDTALSSTLGALAFTGTLEGPHALSLHASGTVLLGATADIGSLGSTATETQLAADLTTAGDISLANTRVVGDVALTSTAGSVQINGVVNGLQDNSDSLSIAADGQIALQGAVGNADRLHDLSLSAATVSTVAVEVGNRLAIDSIGSINQGGRYGVGGTARFASSGDITLLHSSNAFGGDVELTGNHVQIAAQGPLSLSGVDADLLLATSGDQLSVRDARVASSSTLTGQAVLLDDVALGQTADVVALGGNITQQGGVRVDGPSQWIAAGNVLLDNDANQLNGAVTAQGNTVSLATAGALDVANVQASGQATLRGNGVYLGSVQATGLQVDSSAGITQGSALNLASGSRFTAVDDVLLDNAGNAFGGGIQLVGRNIDIRSAGGLLLNGVEASGSLRAAAAGGSLLQSGDVRVQGRSDLLAVGSVQLDRAGNQFGGPVAVEGQSILLRAGSGLDMESVRNGSNGAVQLLATGDIDVAGDAIDTGNSLLSLLSSAGQVRTATALRGGQVSIGGVEGIRIGGDITATTLAMTSARNDVLQQSGRIQSGNALLSAGQGDLRLTSADNRFNGVTTLYGRDVDMAAGGLLLGDVAVSRNLKLDSSGSITQQAQMRVTGTSDLRAAADITLLNTGNDFGGDVALRAQQAGIHAGQALSLAQVHVDGLVASAVGDLSLHDATVAGQAQLDGASITLARADVGRLDATASNGSITQTDRAGLGAGSTLTASGDVLLAHAGNQLGSGLQVQGRNVSLSTLGVLDQADVLATGLVQLAGEGVQLGAVNAGSLQVDSTGDIGQRVALQVAGDSRFAASGHIALDNAGNQFGGGVQLSGNDANIASAGRLRLDGVAAAGDFTAVAHGGSIGQTGSVQVQGRSDLTARDDIILQAAGNSFGGAVALDAAAITLQADSSLQVDGLHTRNDGTAWLQAVGNLSLVGNAVDLGSGALLANATAGALSTGTALKGGAVVLQGRDGVAVGGDITAGQLVLNSSAGDVQQQAGRIQASGPSAVVSNSGDIVLGNTGNRFDDTLLLIGRDIRLAAGDLQLDGVQASGDLQLDSSGSITQSEGMRVAGSTDLRAAGDITLQHAGNRFDGEAALRGGRVAIRADDGLSLAGVAVDQLDASTLDALSLTDAVVSGDAVLQGGSILLSGSDVGRLDATASAGNITQSGAISAGAGSQLSASGDIVLDDSGNQLGSGLQAQGGNITLASAGLLHLTNLQASGMAQLSGKDVVLGVLAADRLWVDSGAGIGQSGALVIGHDSRFSAADDVILDNAGNQFGSGVQVDGRDVRIASAGALQLDGVTARGDLAARALGGDLTQGDALTVAGRSDLLASGTLVLADAGNQFGGAVALQGQAVVLQAGGNLHVDGVRNATNGGVQLSAAGDLQVDGTAIDTGTQALVLTSHGQLRSGTALQGDSVRLHGGSGVLLGADVSAGRDLQLGSGGGDIVQSGGRIVSGGSTGVDAGSGNVILAQAGNDFGGTLDLRGANMDVAGGDLQLASVTATGAVALDSSGSIIQTGAVVAAGDARFNAASSITLQQGGNRFGGNVAVQAQQVAIASDAALALQADISGDLQARSGGRLQLQGEVGGTARLLGGQVNLGRTTVGGNLQVDSSGTLSQDAAISVAGATRLSSRGAVVMDNAGNTFGGDVDVAGNHIALAASGDLHLAQVDTSGGAGLVPQAAGGAVQIAATGNLVLPATIIDTGTADLSLSSGGVLQTRAALAGGNVSLGGSQGVQLGHDVRAGGTLAVDSNGSITQSAGTLSAARLQGRAGGAVVLTGANQIDALGDFTAASLDLATQGGLQVQGNVRSSGNLQLQTRGGDLQIDGSVQGDNVRLLSAGHIAAGDNGSIIATTLSGRAAGATRLGEAGRFVANQVQTLGDFQSRGGFSLTNARTLTLASVNGSSWSVDAGIADFFLKVDGGDLLQSGTTPVYAGTSHWWSSGHSGTQPAPIYLVSDGIQHTVDHVGQPPAYFYAYNRQSMPLVLVGALNVPTAILGARAQGGVLPRVAYLDMGALNVQYHVFRIVQAGIRLPAGQAPACDSADPDAECAQ